MHSQNKVINLTLIMFFIRIQKILLHGQSIYKACLAAPTVKDKVP